MESTFFQKKKMRSSTDSIVKLIDSVNHESMYKIRNCELRKLLIIHKIKYIILYATKIFKISIFLILYESIRGIPIYLPSHGCKSPFVCHQE